MWFRRHVWASGQVENTLSQEGQVNLDTEAASGGVIDAVDEVFVGADMDDEEADCGGDGGVGREPSMTDARPSDGLYTGSQDPESPGLTPFTPSTLPWAKVCIRMRGAKNRHLRCDQPSGLDTYCFSSSKMQLDRKQRPCTKHQKSDQVP
ncbi:15769_t:CDS:2 [Acaulospora colombiana]|uniref:15769_t:CDS:1 n=1 Tax=Acaulospora colombiana TaxID=27376 RepID=A0ACA9MZ37_9GLOM|nr:15769_t:CDS:2 [Acaulospora colombiana]